VNTQALK
jgi:hypothetical protein